MKFPLRANKQSLDGFENFEANFKPATKPRRVNPWLEPILASEPHYQEFASKYAGTVFRAGLYRFYDSETGPFMQEMATDAFPDLHPEARVFGSDWLGRQYAMHPPTGPLASSYVVMLDVETGGTYGVGANFIYFHEKYLTFDERFINRQLFQEWASNNWYEELENPYSSVGYVDSLSIGGQLSASNLRLVNMKTHWAITSQTTPKF